MREIWFEISSKSDIFLPLIEIISSLALILATWAGELFSTFAIENFGAKLKRGWDTAVSTTGLIFNAVGNLFRHFSLNKLSGPVGIYSQTSQVSNMGLTYVLAYSLHES